MYKAPGELLRVEHAGCLLLVQVYFTSSQLAQLPPLAFHFNSPVAREVVWYRGGRIRKLGNDDNVQTRVAAAAATWCGKQTHAGQHFFFMFYIELTMSR